jgi:hypothetical protein
MRPLLTEVDATASPARMTLCFPDRPNRYITVRIRGAATTHRDACDSAVAELAAFTPEQLQLLAECSAPLAVAPDPDLVNATISPVAQERRYPGVLYCPACCGKLGRGDSPAIGYLERCPSCRRRLLVRFAPGTVSVILWTEIEP